MVVTRGGIALRSLLFTVALSYTAFASKTVIVILFTTAASTVSPSSLGTAKAMMIFPNDSPWYRRKPSPATTDHKRRYKLRHSKNDVIPLISRIDEGSSLDGSAAVEAPKSPPLDTFPVILVDCSKSLGSDEALEAEVVAGSHPDVASTSLSTLPLTSERLLTREVTLVTTYLSVVMVLSVVFNGALGCVFFSRRQLLTVSNYFVLNLIACQLGLSLLILPLCVASVVHGKWVLSDTCCRGQSFLLVVVVVALHYTLMVISLDRNSAIVNSLRYPSVFTPTLAISVIAGTWMMGLAVGVPPLVGWGVFGFDSAQFLCSVHWGADQGYALFFLVLVFGLPLLVHIWCYGSIFRAALRHSRRYSKVYPSPVSVTTTTTSTTTTTTTTISTSAPSTSSAPESPTEGEPKAGAPGGTGPFRTECKALKTVVVISATFLVCWTMYVVLAGLKSRAVVVSPSLEMASTALLFLSCVLNPVIYGFMNRVTRFELWKLWCRTCRRLWRRPPPSFPDSEDALSSTWSTTLFSSSSRPPSSSSSSSTRPPSSTLRRVMPSQRARLCSRGVTCAERAVEEMLTIREETEVDEVKAEEEEDVGNDNENRFTNESVILHDSNKTCLSSVVSTESEHAANKTFVASESVVFFNRDDADQERTTDFEDVTDDIKDVDTIDTSTKRGITDEEGDAFERDVGHQSDVCKERGSDKENNICNERDVGNHFATMKPERRL